jgi:hypothetical protein
VAVTPVFSASQDALAQAPAAAPAPGAGAVDDTAFFRVGEMYEAFGWASFYEATGDRAGERFDGFIDQCRRLGAPPEVLMNIDAVRGAMLAMPFLQKPYADWTEQEEKEFADSPSLDFDAWVKWLNEPGFEPRFYWHLGRDSFKGWFIYARNIKERGSTLKSYEEELRTLARDFKTLLTDTGYETARARLNPEALEALRTIAQQSQRMEDPFGDGVTEENLDVIQKNCLVFRNLAREDKLAADAAR